MSGPSHAESPGSASLVRFALVAADPQFRDALQRAVADHPGRVELAPVDPRGPDLERRLAEVDCVVVDAATPDLDQLLPRLRPPVADVPVLLLVDVDAPGLDVDERLTKAELEPERLAAAMGVAIRIHSTNCRLRSVEAELRESVERLRRTVASRDRVLAVVSHDLRGPLNNIELAAGLLEEDVPRAQRELAIASIRRAVARADRLIGDLLDVARLSAGAVALDCAPVEPELLVHTAAADVQPAIEQHQQQLVIQLGPDLVPIVADRDRVIQVLDNLLRNAIKYGPHGGTVLIEALRRGERVEFAVTDQGPGLDDDAQAHVFDRFWRARERDSPTGSGLGLAIAQGLVLSHGGDIAVTSRPGCGARFHFTLPIRGPVANPRAPYGRTESL